MKSRSLNIDQKHPSFPDYFSVPWIVQVALNCQLDIQEWLIWRLFVRRLNPIRIPTCSPLGPDATVCTFVVFGNWLLSARGPRLCPKRGWETQTKLCRYTQSTLWFRPTLSMTTPFLSKARQGDVVFQLLQTPLMCVQHCTKV